MNGKGGIRLYKKCCENCCELHQTGDKYYCLPVGEIRTVCDLNKICNHYEDCRIEQKG